MHPIDDSPQAERRKLCTGNKKPDKEQDKEDHQADHIQVFFPGKICWSKVSGCFRCQFSGRKIQTFIRKNEMITEPPRPEMEQKDFIAMAFCFC